MGSALLSGRDPVAFLGARRLGAVARECFDLAVIFASTVLAALLALAVAAHVVPGWSSTVVASGSMAPLVRPGDVVVFKRADIADVAVGSVVVFAREDGAQVAHRVVGVDADGSLRTRGDANLTADSGVVSRDELRGRAFVLIPWIGLPRVWWDRGDHLRSVLAITVVAVAVIAREGSGTGAADRCPRHGWPLTWLHGPAPAVRGGLLGEAHRNEILGSARALS